MAYLNYIKVGSKRSPHNPLRSVKLNDLLLSAMNPAGQDGKQQLPPLQNQRGLANIRERSCKIKRLRSVNAARRK